MGRKAYQEYQEYSDKERTHAAKKIANECTVPSAPAEAVSKCLAHGIEAYQDQEATEQDLQAQQEMATWAFWMFAASVGAVAVSLVSVVLLVGSLRQTRNAISLDREVGHAQVRAYLSVDPEGIKAGPLGITEAEIVIRNTGQSPAYAVRYAAALRAAAWPLIDSHPNIVEADPAAPAPRVIIAAGGKFTGEALYAEDGAPVPADVFRECVDSETTRLYVSCIVYYKDVFGEARETRMCAFLGKTEDDSIEEGEETSTRLGWVSAPYQNDAT